MIAAGRRADVDKLNSTNDVALINSYPSWGATAIRNASTAAGIQNDREGIKSAFAIRFNRGRSASAMPPHFDACGRRLTVYCWGAEGGSASADGGRLTQRRG